MNTSSGMLIAEILIFGLLGISVLFASKINEFIERRARRQRGQTTEKSSVDGPKN